MSWNICFFAAVAVIGIASVVVFWMQLRKRRGAARMKGIHVLMAACFSVAIILGVAPHYVENGGGVWEAFVSSFTNSILIFGAEANYAVLSQTVHMAPDWMGPIYTAMILVAQVLAPILTFGFLLSFFKNISGYLRLFTGYFRDIYVFSELNEKSLALATDLQRNHPQARLVFADVYDSDDEDLAELAVRARQIGSVCFKLSISNIRLHFHGKGTQIYFFAIAADEAQNVHHALQLIESYNQRPNTHLYLFSTGTEGELLLSGADRGAMKVRRIHEDRSLVFRMLYEQGNVIFDTARPMPNGDRQISAVIVGVGSHGTEMLKSLVWFTQMEHYHIKINAFDMDPLAEEKFAALCPELMSPRYNGVQVPGDAEYTISIHSGCDVHTKTFADRIAQIDDATYVFISLGSDQRNIRTAAMLRMYFERNGAKPVICAVCGSSDARQVLGKAHNSAGQYYDIQLVGDVESCYTEKVILQSDAEADAFRRHKAYCDGDPEKEEDFWRHEYCYRSSMASAIHATARKKRIPGAEKAAKDMTPQERQRIEDLEHRRWNAYMRSEGYVYSGSSDRASRNDLAKMHHNLVVFGELSDADKRKDSRVASENG